MKKSLVVVFLILAGPACAQTFGVPFVPTVIPDGALPCSSPLPALTKIVTVPPGLSAISLIQVRVGINHTWYGDLNLTVEHGGTTVSLLGPLLPCSGIGLAADFGGLYTFDDEATLSIDTAAVVFGGLILPGSYRGDNPLSVFLGTLPAGSWTITIWDQHDGHVGTLFDARVTFGCVTAYTVTQPGGPGNPLQIAHTCGVPFKGYLSAFVLGSAIVPNNAGLFGLAIEFSELASQISLGPPFFGTLDFDGNALFSIPVVPPFIMLSTVGIQFDFPPSLNTVLFVQPAFIYTTV